MGWDRGKFFMAQLVDLAPRIMAPNTLFVSFYATFQTRSVCACNRILMWRADDTRNTGLSIGILVTLIPIPSASWYRDSLVKVDDIVIHRPYLQDLNLNSVCVCVSNYIAHIFTYIMHILYIVQACIDKPPGCLIVGYHWSIRLWLLGEYPPN